MVVCALFGGGMGGGEGSGAAVEQLTIVVSAGNRSECKGRFVLVIMPRDQYPLPPSLPLSIPGTRQAPLKTQPFRGPMVYVCLYVCMHCTILRCNFWLFLFRWTCVRACVCGGGWSFWSSRPTFFLRCALQLGRGRSNNKKMLPFLRQNSIIALYWYVYQ